jgi:hypothetical protein
MRETASARSSRATSRSTAGRYAQWRITRAAHESKPLEERSNAMGQSSTFCYENSELLLKVN